MSEVSLSPNLQLGNPLVKTIDLFIIRLPRGLMTMQASTQDAQSVAKVDPSVAFFAAAVLYFSVAVGWMALRAIDEVILSIDLPLGRWVMLHFITIGAATQVLFGSLPALSARYAERTLPQSTGSRWIQWLLLNVGWIFVLLGMSGGSSILASIGTLLIIGALALLMATVYGILRSATAPIAMYYRWAPVFFVVGLVMAMSMLLGWWAPNGYFGMIEAHVHANVWGFLALIAAGSLYLLIPIFSRQPLARPEWQRSTFRLLATGAAGLVAGPWLGIHALTFGGLGLYGFGLLRLLTNLIKTFRAGRRTASGHHLLWAFVWMIVPVPFAPVILLTPELIPAAQVEAAATLGLVYGWTLQMLMGALPWVILRLRDPKTGRAGRGRVTVEAELHDVETGTPWSVVAVNAGVGLLWLQALSSNSALVSTLNVMGYVLLALGMTIFVVRPWTALTGQLNAAGALVCPTQPTS